MFDYISKKTVLVFAPHPDDELIGAGGVIAKHSSNMDHVIVCIATKGYGPLYDSDIIEQGRKEALAAHKRLGVKKTIFLDFPANELSSTKQYILNDTIYRYIKSIMPDIVYIPFSGDIHYDHKALADSCLVALRPKENTKAMKVLAYEVPSETGWDAPFVQNAFIPNVYVDISDYLEMKKECLGQFKSQISDFPCARSVEALEALAKYRGSTVGKKAAEAFMLIREVAV